MPYQGAAQTAATEPPDAGGAEEKTADHELITHAARLLEQQGYRQAATVIRFATRLERPPPGTRFSGRWTMWTDLAIPTTQRYEITQQIKRALNAIGGADASYVDMRASAVDGSGLPHMRRAGNSFQ
ncbi:hypothetical protein [Catenulispora pinisilvae]|uniref:hypothetical protein n=1 Tax=Catenulispora pinisilvae TaxID=2705253 RepID=UPI001891F215|nr:hypothetical protein [Catenulispora pinisilvae]